MADQKRWFKLWCSAPSDDDLLALDPATRWAWAALGCYTKEHGTRGTVQISATNTVLAAQMGVTVDALQVVISMLPHVCVEEGKTDNGKFTVTWQNWQKYQEDSTVAERVARLRSKRRGEEKRGEERRREVPPVVPHTQNGHGDPTRAQCLELLAFLNLKTGKSYRPVPANLTLIAARLKSGASMDDCRGVIARKVREWGTDPKMAAYLRPATLFNATKFECYIGQQEAQP